jgi:ankyrin repeat protein
VVTINTEDEVGIIYFMYAAVLGNLEMVRLLLDHGASPLSQTCGKNVFGFIDYILQNKELTTQQQEVYKDILRSCLKWILKNLYLIQKRGGLTATSGKQLPNEILYMILDKFTYGVISRYNLLSDNISEETTLKIGYVTAFALTMFGINEK